MTDYEEIKATLESKGMKLIVKELRGIHKGVYRRYKDCSPNELVHLQQLQKLIDTTVPQIIERLMNKHLEPRIHKKTEEWWHFDKWIKKLFR